MEKKIQDARNILQQIGMPLSQQNDICVYTLLSLAGITDDSNWEEADNQWIGIHDIITAFLFFFFYRKFVKEIAWETEVWLAEMPEHMLHMNGDKFMGPR